MKILERFSPGIVCVTYGASKHDSNTGGNWQEKPGRKVVEFELCFSEKLRKIIQIRSHFLGPNRSQKEKSQVG